MASGVGGEKYSFNETRPRPTRPKNIFSYADPVRESLRKKSPELFCVGRETNGRCRDYDAEFGTQIPTCYVALMP